MSSATVTTPAKCTSFDEFWTTYEGQHAQLIDGEVYLMPPVHPPHTSTVHRITRRLIPVLSAEAGFTLRQEAPLMLPDLTDPEPGIAIVRGADDAFDDCHPTAEEAVLIIEVSDTTLGHDRRTKLPRYAAAGVPEVWIVNLIDHVVERYRAPDADRRRYALHDTVPANDELVATAVPAVTVRPSELLG